MKIKLITDKSANTIDDIIAVIEATVADIIRSKIPNRGSLHKPIESVLACKANSVGAYLDVSCAEYDLSTYVLIHVPRQPSLTSSWPTQGWVSM
jgi:methylaspartate ammonia-lyase